MSKCDLCPLKNEDVPCVAVSSGHARYCELIAEGRQDYVKVVVSLSRRQKQSMTGSNTNTKGCNCNAVSHTTEEQ